MNIRFNMSYFPWQNRGSKSEQNRLQRQAQRDGQVAFLEKQKNNLKYMKCDSLEEISRKLDMFQSYEDQIAAVEEAYNTEQMHHLMDEARERGEKVAEAAEKHAPKTAEERKEEMVEEALGTEEEKGLLTEVLEEVTELAEEMNEETLDEAMKTTTDALEKVSVDPTESSGEVSVEAVDAALAEDTPAAKNGEMTEPQTEIDQMALQEKKKREFYRSIDYYV